jgi:Ca2+-transporting ATPase
MQMEALVIRDGLQEKINANDVVVGDIVVIQSGDKVPADMRLCKVKDLQTVEASLTGESLPIQKKSEVLKEVGALGDLKNMAFAGSYVTYGQATGVVTSVGVNTEIGKISKLIAEADELETPLGKKIAAFSQTMLYVIMGAAVLTFVIGYFHGTPFIDNLMAAVALAVGAIPEGLPAAMTTILAIGVKRMAEQNAIIRKLPVVETLGSATVICSDKTGTLTENQMTVEQIYSPDRFIFAEGVGYKPEGKLTENGKPAEKLPVNISRCLRAGFVCNDSRLLENAGVYAAQGDPTEVALIVSAKKGNLDSADFKRLDSIPFESQNQFMAVLAQEGEEKMAYLKGSAEKILERCARAMDENGNLIPLDENRVHEVVDKMASQGLRVLAFAQKKFDKNQIRIEDLNEDCVFTGLQAMIDPPRAEAIESVRVCKEAGIVVKMITGDHAVTAQAIAVKLGIAEDTEGRAGITGKMLEAMSEKEFENCVVQNNVFARVSPEQKYNIVKSLQRQHNVVAMTGDGVNDAPALRQADIGVAMGITGTEVSKEAADMVLTDDNFYTIRAAVEEGRGTYDNLIKFILWTLPTNFGEGLVLLVAVLLNVTLPILPVQILWINMTTAGFLGLTLAFEPKEDGIMQRKPRNPKASIFSRVLTVRLIYVSVLLTVFAFGLFEWSQSLGASLAQSRTLAVTVFVMVEMAYLFNCRALHMNTHKIGAFSNIWVWAGSIFMFLIQLLFIYLPSMNKIFESEPIEAHYWLPMIASMAIVYIIVEVEKVFTKDDV